MSKLPYENQPIGLEFFYSESALPRDSGSSISLNKILLLDIYLYKYIPK